QRGRSARTSWCSFSPRSRPGRAGWMESRPNDGPESYKDRNEGRTNRMKAILAVLAAALLSGQAKDNTPPEGFTALFNGKDLTGWQGLVEIDKRNKDPEKYAAQVKAANDKYLPHWSVQDGVIVYDGKGQSLQTVKDYRDFELWVDWKIGP